MLVSLLHLVLVDVFFEEVVVALLVLEVDVVEIAVEESICLNVLRVGLDLIETCLTCLVLAL